MDKTKYVLHYRNLQIYLSLGMKLKKIHRILEFNEAPWMEPYIRMNTEFRKKSKSAFEKDFYKLMNNSVFGKTMENLRKRVDIKVVRTCGNPKEKEQIRKIIAKPNYDRAVIFSEELSALHSHKTRFELNKPVYVGVCPGLIQALDVCLVLQYTQTEVRQPVHFALHRHRQLTGRPKNARCICRHGIHENSLRLLRLPQGPPALQRAKQKGHRQVQG